jgi:hypothetical protein
MRFLDCLDALVLCSRALDEPSEPAPSLRLVDFIPREI